MTVWDFQIQLDNTEFFFPIEEDKIMFKKFCQLFFEISEPVNTKWESLVLIGYEPKKFTDFFEIENSGVIAISKKGLNALSIYKLGQKVEFLPVLTDWGDFYAINNLNYIDCLVLEQSDCKTTFNGFITTYNTLSFESNKLKGELIFKIPQLPYVNFITEEFKECYYKGFLKGLDFDVDNIVYQQ